MFPVFPLSFHTTRPGASNAPGQSCRFAWDVMSCVAMALRASGIANTRNGTVVSWFGMVWVILIIHGPHGLGPEANCADSFLTSLLPRASSQLHRYKTQHHFTMPKNPVGTGSHCQTFPLTSARPFSLVSRVTAGAMAATTSSSRAVGEALAAWQADTALLQVETSGGTWGAAGEHLFNGCILDI